MKTKEVIPPLIEMRIDFPNLLVKTHYGNVYLKSMIRNKRTIVYINPSEMIPAGAIDKKKFLQTLKTLKDMNFHLIGFNRRSFEEHLTSVNWLNSYIKDDLVFPIFYQTENEPRECLEKDLPEKIDLKNPVYFLDENGTTQAILNGTQPEARSLEKIAELASELVLREQNFQKNKVLRES